MCVVSMVADSYRDRWNNRDHPMYPWVNPINPWVNPINPVPKNPFPDINPTDTFPVVVSDPNVKKEIDKLNKDFADLKRQVEEMIDLIKRAKEYDLKNNEPDCEIAEKMEWLKSVAKLFGLEIQFVKAVNGE